MNNEISVYVDDVLIQSYDFYAHLSNVANVLDKIREAGMTLNLAKTQFFTNKLCHLGYELNTNTINKQETKIKKLEEFKNKHYSKRQKEVILKNNTQVQRLLGLTNFYQKFIPQYQTIVRPLTKVSTPNTFQWGEEQISAFNKLQEAFEKKFDLQKPDYTNDFYLTM